ncbi:hypothetical protein DFH09DRAFT_1185129 [Mycena vulgaris]|nr:hypothetical protein DFH09DRAFT_1185129 [Mycena vulgaris]
MNDVVDSGAFEDRWSTMLFTVSVNSTVLLLYALYVILFVFSIHTLNKRAPAVSRFLIGTAWAMFLLGTCGTVIVIVSTAISMRMVYLLVQGSSAESARLLYLYQSLALTQDIVLAINNLVTDSLLLYRCYVIWGSRKRILLVPGILILATMILGFISGLGYYRLISLAVDIDPRVPFTMATTTNILLMCLTAGRIWYIGRQAQTVTGQRFRQRYDTAVAIILESGLLYCLCAIIYVISASLNSGSASAMIFNGVAWGLFQLGVVSCFSNIVPTLILVRVGLGRSTENTTPFTAERNISHSYPVFASKDNHSANDGKRNEWHGMSRISGQSEDRFVRLRSPNSP